MDDIRKAIEAIEEEMAKTPYHKGTQKWFGKMRAKIAKLRARQTEKQTKKGSGGGGFGLRKFGHATIVLVGFPSVGKSTLLNKLTNAKSPTAGYDFTTVSVIPGMMNYHGAQIQILDIPGLIKGAAYGSGRGREVLSVVRGADLLLMIVEAGKEKEQFEKITHELEENGVRINESRPKVAVRKTIRGGIKINFSIQQELSRETIVEIAREFGIINAEILLKEKINMSRFIDSLAPNRVYIPALFVVNKIDTDIHPNKLTYLSERDGIIRISAQKEVGLDKLKEQIWSTLGLIRVYLRQMGSKEPSNEPLIMHEGQTLWDVLNKVSREMATDKTKAKVWGPDARFPGQAVSFEAKVQDGMEISFI